MMMITIQDQQITAVIVNRKENLLKKGGGYHLDLLIVAIGIIVNSLLGIPWSNSFQQWPISTRKALTCIFRYVASTILSVTHVQVSISVQVHLSASKCIIYPKHNEPNFTQKCWNNFARVSRWKPKQRRRGRNLGFWEFGKTGPIFNSQYWVI